MADLQPADFRNVALAGHASTGKTSLTEAMLHAAKATPRLGRVDDGSSILDFEQQERERRFSIDLAVGHASWQGRELQLLDTPGYPDFVGDVIAALRAADTALLLVSALAGLELHTRRAWAAAEQAGKARAVVINKVDAENAKFFETLQALRQAFGRACVPVTVPDAEGAAFSRVVSTLRPPDDLAGELADRVNAFHEELMESIVEADEALMERYLEGEAIGDEALAPIAVKAVQEGTLVPVFATSAAKETGVVELLDAIAAYFPSPVDVGAVSCGKPDSEEQVEREPSLDAPFCAQAFQVMTDPFVGKMTFVRVFSGSMGPDEPLYLPRTGKRERSAGLFTVLGKEQQPLARAIAGQIACITKVDALQIGDTICAESDAVVLPPIEFPTPMVSLAVQPQSRGDEPRLSSGLSKLADEDGTFLLRRDEQTRELVITGTSMLHLDVMLARLRTRFDAHVATHEPKIPYLETITASAEAKYRHKKQTGGRGQYGEVYLRLEPNERGGGFEFINEVVGGAIPSQFIPAVEKGVRETMGQGVLAGYPIVDLKAAAYDGSYHSVDSSEQAFKTAANYAFREAFSGARPCLLEPIVNIEITVPSKYMGDIASDINGRRGRVIDVESIGDLQVIKATCPLAELQRYSTELRSITGGEGSFTMDFARYDVVPRNKQEQIVAAAQKAKQEK